LEEREEVLQHIYGAEGSSITHCTQKQGINNTFASSWGPSVSL